MSSGISIGEIAKLVSVKPSTIRYYESERIIPQPGRRAGRRVYSSDDVTKIRMVVAARSLGFSIGEIKAMSELDGEARRDTASSRAKEIRSSIVELSRLADQMEELSACECGSENECHLASS